MDINFDPGTTWSQVIKDVQGEWPMPALAHWPLPALTLLSVCTLVGVLRRIIKTRKPAPLWVASVALILTAGGLVLAFPALMAQIPMLAHAAKSTTAAPASMTPTMPANPAWIASVLAASAALAVAVTNHPRTSSGDRIRTKSGARTRKPPRR